MPRLFLTTIESDANLKVYVTDIRSDADLVIFETENQWEATEAAIWCYTDVRSDADRIVYLTDGQWNADIKVFKTDIQSDAQWINSGKADLL